MNDILDVLKNEFDSIIEHLKSEFAHLQIGRASSALVEGIFVESYGVRQPLKAVANISIPDAKTIQIQPWNKDQLVDIEKAIASSDLNLTPMNDGVCVRINIPDLTEERRKDLVKVVHKMAEDARISVRQARQKAIDSAKKLEKNGDITEDDLKGLEKKIQARVDDTNKLIEEMVKNKEKDVLTV